MGIPYSREINAAFEQVTPLVAAGFKVLKTTRNISILLAIIQVLTVFLLALILAALLLVVYSVNPDLERERKQLVTPILQWLASIRPWSVIKGTVSAVVGVGIMLGASWWAFFVVEGRGIEGEGNQDADKALEEMDGKEKEKAKKRKKDDKDEKEEDKKK